MGGLRIALLVLTVLWTSPTQAQFFSDDESPSGSRPAPQTRKAPVRTSAMKPGQLIQPRSRNSTGSSAESAKPRGGFVQQFKSFTNSLIEDTPEEQLEQGAPSNNGQIPEALEARRRKIFEPGGNKALQRNKSAIERGMPAPPPRDPPSLDEDTDGLPPIVSGSDEMQSQNERSTRTTTQEPFTAKRSIPTSTPNKPSKPSASMAVPSQSTTSVETLGNSPDEPASKKKSSRRSTSIPSDSEPTSSINKLDDANESTSTLSKPDDSSMNSSRAIPDTLPTKQDTLQVDETTEAPSIRRKSIPQSSSSSPSTPPAGLPVSTRNQPVDRSSTPDSNSFDLAPSSSLKSPSTSFGTSTGTYESSRPSSSKPNTSSSNLTEEQLLQMTLPKVELTLNGTPSLRVNSTSSFELVAKNQDQLPLNGLIARLGIPNSVSIKLIDANSNETSMEADEQGGNSLVWQIENLGPGETRSMRFDLVASKPEHFAIDVEWTALPQTASSDLQVEQPMLQIALEGASEVIYGRPEIYRLRIRNPGNADAKSVDVTLQADSFGENSTNIGDVPAGAERMVEVELTFQHAGTMPISAIARSTSMSLESNTKIDVRVQQAALEMEWSGPESQYQGSISEYSVSLHNRSAMTSENIQCYVSIPEGATPMSLPDGAKVVGKEITWRVPRLEANQSLSFPIELQTNETGEFAVQLRCEGSAGGSAQSTATVQVDSISDLKLSVIDPTAPAPVGSNVTYEVVVENRGSKEATGVRVLAQFSNGIEPVKANGHSHQLVPGQVVFEPIPSIPAGQSVRLQVTALASEAGMHRFRAEVSCDDQDTQLLHEESTRYLASKRSESTTRSAKTTGSSSTYQR